ncbi:unnamed protein product [Rotaria socialis]|uniref:HECT-type E3 ubiquitin transferase n=1 Tax=Rotaria socialis TaxID=392032 RepID=A0A817Q5S5_9BILA|nr:unnamed protein product [Rotaria socialis]CAF3341594.1 unnamed protein product [Rotaria socialis]CAF3356851.1 unnamed protein product [Rotaria socialis]CAF3382951.1 unnamed protein product [Rotaria socialis]CAF3519147.1 unnamed protein product [Rotaria socialis]
MANGLRRNSFSELPTITSHCRRCQLDIESDPQANGRTRILCPFCGEFLFGPNVTDIQQLKEEINKRAKDDNSDHGLSLRSRFSRTFNRILLRRQNMLNNNGITASHRRDKTIKNVKLPAIENKKQLSEQKSKDKMASSSLPMIATAISMPSINTHDIESFQRLVNEENSDNNQIFTFFSIFYSNLTYMMQSLTLNDDKKQIDWKYLQIIHEYITNNSDTISRLILKTIASCCVREIRPSEHTRKGYTILMMAPVFDDASNNHIFAHVLRRISHFVDHEQQEIILVLQTLPVEMFRLTVRRLQAFVAINLFPSRLDNSSSTVANGWWIPSAIRTLALFNHANEMISGRKIPLQEMVIDSLNYIDEERDYFEWKNRKSRGIIGGFTFCQYPFVLSINAKRTILKRDSEQQMIVNARRSMIQKVQNKQIPNLNMLFLNFYIRRAHLVADSLAEVTKNHEDLKKKLRVTFVGEHGLDMGGLTKEWFLLLIRHIFSPDYGMFVYYDLSGIFWFNGASTDNVREYHLVGILMGLAVYNAIILDIRFPLVCYKKLLTPAFLTEQMTRLSKIKVGIIKSTLADFRTIRPDIANSLQYLLDYDGNVEEDFGLTFEVSVAQFDTSVIYPLKENGSTVDVTNENRNEYVELLIDFYINKHVSKQFEAFYYGFHSVCSSNALLLLLPEELEMLICGMQQCNLSSLAKITKYENCNASEDFIKWFWQVVEEMSSDKQRRLLLFVTGSDRMPIGGLSEMTFKIAKISSNRCNIHDLLPMSHTCFNQLLLPPYSTREILKEKLLLAIENCEGFGIE